MVAWVSTKDGRLRLAAFGCVVAVFGAGLVAASVLTGFRLLAWTGGLLILTGVAITAWALLHETISGLHVLPRSIACREGRHVECGGAEVRNGRRACSCACHEGIVEPTEYAASNNE